MAKFTVDQLEKAINELDAGRYCSGDSDVIGMLRAFAARLQEADQNAKDAARYRWLRRKVAIIGKNGLLGESADRYCVFEFCNLPSPTYIAPDPCMELDAAIDAAMREQGEG